MTTGWSGTLIAGVVLASLAGVASAAHERETVRTTVFAASSLTDVLPKIDPRPRYSFASSSTLAQQIRQGAPADVFASADMSQPLRLRAAGLCGKPSVFATNALVVVVPKSNPSNVRTVRDLGRRGVKVVIAKPGVPAGDYTRSALRKLGLLRTVLANVVSQEPAVRGVLAKVALGEADAGIVYRTDAATVSRRVGVIRLPARARPAIRYGICVVTAGDDRAAARAFVAKALGRPGRAELAAAGFGLP
ncbi:MAG TPA: molybdate ABC transporter substrate-binding protein [Gaiellaceae bacterium]|nr:molybdate ABC transporter substrate-binding protein [Gaiellaceae bacterium]